MEPAAATELRKLEPLLGQWTVEAVAPDGVAIFAVDEDSGELIQHYFDSRGVVRRYATSIEDRVWSHGN